MKKQLFCSIFLFVFLFGFAVDSDEAPTVRILFTGATQGHSLKFSDDNGDNQGGYAARKTLIDQITGNDRKNVVLVDTGNFLGENYVSSLLDGKPDFTGMNLLGYDVAGLGIAEINRTQASYNKIRQKSSFTFINGNVKTLKGQKIGEPYFIKIVNGVKIAFVSVLDENIYLVLSQDAKDAITIENPVMSLEPILKRLKEKENPDVICALTNIGYFPDNQTGAGFLASLYPDIDLIIEGSYGANKNRIFNVSGTRIYTIAKKGIYLGDVSFKVNKKESDKKHLEILSESFYPVNVRENGRKIAELIPEDKKVLAALEKMTEKVDAQLSRVSAEVIASDFSSVGKMEKFTKLCCLVTDALRVKTGTDVAFLNAGLFQETDLSKVKNLKYTFSSGILKYNNTAVVVNLRGKELKDIVEYSMIRRGYGQFLIFSGMTVVYSEKMHKVTDLRIYQKKIVDEKIYRVAVSDYLASGGDSYYFFEREKNKVYTNIPLENLINDYVESLGCIMNDSIDTKRLTIQD